MINNNSRSTFVGGTTASDYPFAPDPVFVEQEVLK